MQSDKSAVAAVPAADVLPDDYPQNPIAGIDGHRKRVDIVFTIDHLGHTNQVGRQGSATSIEMSVFRAGPKWLLAG